MIKLAVVVLVAVSSINAIRVQHAQSAVILPPGDVRLVADNGMYLTFNNANTASTYSTSLQSFSGNDNTTFSLQIVGDKVAFKKGQLYLRLFPNSGSDINIKGVVYFWTVKKVEDTLWTPIVWPNGKYSFKGSNGKYLARCNKCQQYSSIDDLPYGYVTNNTQQVARWDLKYINKVELLNENVLISNNNFENLIVDEFNRVIIGKRNGTWKFRRMDNSTVIVSQRNTYLSSQSGASSIQYVTSLDILDFTKSRWTPIKLPNGLWILRAITGRYLTINKENRAVVSSLNINDDQTQWRLTDTTNWKQL